MKTIEEKAKAYDEALKAAIAAHKDEDRHLKATLERIFPELQESEDERIRKGLIKALSSIGKRNWGGIDVFESISWLEKQAEQKPTDKVKPKFKVGDWITDGYLYNKITDVLEDRYIVDTKFAKRSSIPFKFENYYHLWTIQDAKDGDVLYSKKHNLIWIYKDNKHYYASINLNYADVVSFDNEIVIPSDVCPANRVQRSILFQKMEESNYKWDADKNELKKIEHKPTDNDMKEALRTEYEKGRADTIAEIQNHAWSEEDESYLNTTIAYLKDAKEFKKSAENCINWLKSLKDRVQPILRRRHTIFDEII